MEAGEAPKHKVIIAARDSDNQEILFEPYSVRWESGAVVIEADYSPEAIR